MKFSWSLKQQQQQQQQQQHQQPMTLPIQACSQHAFVGYPCDPHDNCGFSTQWFFSLSKWKLTTTSSVQLPAELNTWLHCSEEKANFKINLSILSSQKRRHPR